MEQPIAGSAQSMPLLSARNRAITYPGSATGSVMLLSITLSATELEQTIAGGLATAGARARRRIERFTIDRRAGRYQRLKVA
jgi:hypothetical protein